jgi:FkbM family methyltransferase
VTPGALPRPALRVGPASPLAAARIGLVRALAAGHARATGGTLRLPVLAALDRLLPAGALPDVEATVAPGVRVELDGRGALARGALLAAGYEHREGEVLASVLAPGGAFLDVGANVGWFSLLLAAHRPAATVHAVEPIPDTADRLQAAVDGAGLTNVVVHRVALGDRIGTVPLVSTSDSAYAHAAALDPGPVDARSAGWRAAAGTVEAPATTVDRLWDELGRPRVDAMKVDVEGGEPAVLAGANELLARCRPLLVVEAQTDERRAAVAHVLEPLGYRFEHVPGVLPYNSVLRSDR